MSSFLAPARTSPRAELPGDGALASLGSSPDAVATDLGLVGPPVKQHEPAVGSEAAETVAVRPGLVEPPPGAIESPEPSGVTAPAVPPGANERAEVRYFLDRFQATPRRAVVEKWLIRSGRYAEMIRDVLMQRGLPEEILFTAMIESGFNPVAVSRAGAKGLWQFMAPTARRYGLRVDRWLDERLDPEKATWAAASYFTDLYAMFGSWHLAQAAYNAGEMRIVRAIQGMRTTDFWQLARGNHLADETKNHVAAIRAAHIIASEPDRFGFAVTPEDAVRYETVRVPPATKLRPLAAAAGLSEGELHELNPALRLGQTPPGEPYAIKVPVGAGPRVQLAAARGPKVVLAGGATASRRAPERVRAPRAVAPAPRAVHVVKPRETVGAIARRYGVSPSDLARWNQIAEGDPIRPGDRLRVARAPAEREDGQGGFR